MKTHIISLLLLLLFGMGLTGCRQDKKYRIAVSQCSEDDWRRKMNGEIEREMLFHENAEVEIRSADDSNEKQIADIQYFIDNDFDILIVSPNEAEALTPIVRNAYEKGIPVIIFDRDIDGDTYTTKIGADNIGLGRAAGRYAISGLKYAPKALEIWGLPGATPAIGRHRGFHEEFTSAGGTVVGSATARWNREDAIPAVDSLLRLYPDVDMIFAHNDRMAIGAAEATRKAGRDDIKIIGIDAAPEIGIKAVADSVIDATFFYPTEGHRLIRTALDILEGHDVDKEIVLPSASVVDKTNADILLMQNEALTNETEHMTILKNKVDEYWAQHSSQTYLFYASIIIICLLCIVIFLILRAYWQRRRYQVELLKQNKELEEQRDKEHELNQKLNEATQSKLVFFTNVSHDLRTPLTLISEPVSRLVNAENLTPQQNKLITLADKNVRILRRLINQILDFRKYENDRLTLNITETSLGSLLREWIESFQTLALKRHIHLSYDISSENETLAVDVEKIERVVFNLVSNAFKYTPDNGKIHISYKIENAQAIISVADTGEGISERDMGNIFERFYQVERVHPNGSGIGLTLSKAFVELHDGNISVESRVKEGSLFTVSIPVKHTATAPDIISPSFTAEDIEAELDSVDEAVAFEDNKELLLIIDDNKDIRQLVTELLQGDYNIITAPNGLEGMRKAARYVPDLIICDVMMPGIDGLECCRRLKEEVTTSHIPVLMLTACSMDEQRIQGYESGADGYISKPFSLDVLKARCDSLIKNRKRIKNLWNKDTDVASTYKNTEEKKGRPLPSSDIDNEFYDKFITIFNAEISNPEISVDILASRMGLERTQFYRKIKALTNYSPVELIRNLRLKHARHLLLTTDKSISEISYDSGFSSPAYFTRCYREANGETPTDTRARTGNREK